MRNFVKKLKDDVDRLDISPREMAQVEADLKCLDFACMAKRQYVTRARAITDFCDKLHDGDEVLTYPEPIVLPEVPPIVPAGVAHRFRKLVKRIKSHPAYTEALGMDLGIVGPERTMDFDNLKPRLRVRITDGRPVLRWSKKGMHSAEIQVNRGHGTYEHLAVCNTPRYEDRATMPEPGSGTIWQYKMIYRWNDLPVGKWSDVVSIGVVRS